MAGKRHEGRTDRQADYCGSQLIYSNGAGSCASA